MATIHGLVEVEYIYIYNKVIVSLHFHNQATGTRLVHIYVYVAYELYVHSTLISIQRTTSSTRASNSKI